MKEGTTARREASAGRCWGDAGGSRMRSAEVGASSRRVGLRRPSDRSERDERLRNSENAEVTVPAHRLRFSRRRVRGLLGQRLPRMAASSEPTILRFDGASTVDDVEAWLAAHKPTRRGYTEPWIYVHDRFTPPPTPDPTRNLDGRYRERAQAISERYMTAWETRRASGTISKAAGLALLATFLDDASALSREYDVRTGKWSIYVGVSEADEVWAKVVRAMALPGGPLRGLAHAAKTGARPGEDGYGGQCTVLCGSVVQTRADLAASTSVMHSTSTTSRPACSV